MTPDQLLAFIWLDAVNDGMRSSTVKVDIPASIAAFGS